MATLANAEIVEMRFPYRITGRELVPDTGGPGQWRGVCGSRITKQTRTPMFLNFSAIGRRWPMKGIAGGRDGAPNRWLYDAESPEEREETGLGYLVNFQPGARWAFQLGGGGGWGDPLEREPGSVLDDVLDGYVSVEGARRDYGVVLTADGTGVDSKATRKEREERRKG
jgi:N-methylhydantoinase B